VQQRIEMGRICLVEAMRLADMGIDDARVFIAEQPLVDALQREFACAMARSGFLLGLACWDLVFITALVRAGRTSFKSG